MTNQPWQVQIKIQRQRAGEKPYVQAFALEVDPDEYVLDAVERIWAFHDRTLTYRHACHHSTCGACGMRVNGREKLTCITTIRSVTQNGGTIRIDPLRNFPVVSDLVVDMGDFFLRMNKSDFNSVAPDNAARLPYEHPKKLETHTEGEPERLVDCIECGLCISACPAANTDKEYVGPAVLAAIHLMYTQNPSQKLINQADGHSGLWRCHSAYECTEVCPSGVDPAWRIMDMRKTVFKDRVKSIIKPRLPEKKDA